MNLQQGLSVNRTLFKNEIRMKMKKNQNWDVIHSHIEFLALTFAELWGNLATCLC